MKILLSPAKNMNFTDKKREFLSTEVYFTDKACELASILKTKSVAQLEQLMDVNFKIAQLNKTRFENWSYPFNKEYCKQAIFAYNGEVYHGLNALSFTSNDLEFAQNHLRIVSGLYGILRPLDAILPYRLELVSKLETQAGTDLFAFWSDSLQQYIQKELDSDDSILINLASNEYSKAIRINALIARVITPVFKDFRNGKLSQIVIYAKKARGMMARFIIKNQLTNVEDLKNFTESGYVFDEGLSSENEWIFTR